MPRRTPNPLPSQVELEAAFRYDHAHGKLYRRVGSGNVKAGARAGGVSGNGYVLVWCKGRQYSAHRIIWKLVYGVEPPELLDHLDGDKTNNDIRNLQPTTVSENTINSNRTKKAKNAQTTNPIR